MKTVVISGLHYAVTAALEYIVRAFRRRGDWNVFTAGPFFGNYMPWKQGMYLPEDYEFPPTIVIPPSLSYDIGAIEAQVPGNVDLWLDVNAGFCLRGKPKHGIRTTFLTDPHVLQNMYKTNYTDYDFVFNPQPNYRMKGDILLPYGFDVEWHSPMDVQKQYDVAMIGNLYQNRHIVYERLRGTSRSLFFEVGPAKEEARNIWNQSIVGLNWAAERDINARCFELAGIGNIIPMCNTFQGMDMFFKPGVHYVSFTTFQDFFEKLWMVEQDLPQSMEIGVNARKNVIDNKHSWDDRVDQILEMIDTNVRIFE